MHPRCKRGRVGGGYGEFGWTSKIDIVGSVEIGVDNIFQPILSAIDEMLFFLEKYPSLLKDPQWKERVKKLKKARRLTEKVKKNMKIGVNKYFEEKMKEYKENNKQREETIPGYNGSYQETQDLIRNWGRKQEK